MGGGDRVTESVSEKVRVKGHNVTDIERMREMDAVRI